MATKIDGMDCEYIGDGVYALNDGAGDIVLRINDPRMPTDTAVLEPEVLRALFRIAKLWGFEA